MPRRPIFEAEIPLARGSLCAKADKKASESGIVPPSEAFFTGECGKTAVGRWTRLAESKTVMPAVLSPTTLP